MHLGRNELNRNPVLHEKQQQHGFPMKNSIICTMAAVAFSAALSNQGSAQDVAPPPTKSLEARKVGAMKAQERLKDAWMRFAERNQRGEMKPSVWARRMQPRILSVDEINKLYKEEGVPFQEPEVICSANGKLEATLTVKKAMNQIGADKVYLRSYNGKLVGPTLKCKAGDTLYITVDNRLEPEAFMPGAMNTLHGFNTTNLHTHGLHVSPSGVSDNVLLEVNPGSAQRYEVVIPKDHTAGTYWYHAHLHGSTAAQVGSGMAGALIIEGGIDDVPEIAQAEQRTLVLQQIPYVNNASKSVCSEIPKDEDLKVGVIEAEYSDCSFGPGTWDQLGRFTTINGQKLPIIRIKPGAVERWRFVMTGIREVIQPELVRHEKSKPEAPERLSMYEVAVDGLALGRVAERSKLELWPGYRSDVLVRAPEVAGAQYVLRDTRVPAQGATFSEERRYLALVVVEGESKSMKLPVDQQLAKFRLPSIDPKSVTGREVAAYGIIPTPSGNGVTFTVDRKPFGTDEARQLTLGEVHEWTLISRNNVGPVSHPFHIHVNPFEIFSMVDPQGVEQLDLDANGKAIPVWRDTIILHEGWKVSMRTAYTDYDGVFVSHCHILDHEDQGMMELIQIAKPPASSMSNTTSVPQKMQPYPAPNWSLPDGTGQERSFAELAGGPALLVFFEGFGCLRCNDQLQAINRRIEEFQKSGLKVIAVSTDTVDSVREGLKETPMAFPIVADPEQKIFRAYGCHAGGPLHGAFLVDDTANVRWQVVSKAPYQDLDQILKESKSMSAPLVPSNDPKRAAASR